jgi:hypothetical protein
MSVTAALRFDGDPITDTMTRAPEIGLQVSTSQTVPSMPPGVPGGGGGVCADGMAKRSAIRVIKPNVISRPAVLNFE